MTYTKEKQIKEVFLGDLYPTEHLKAIGVFKILPKMWAFFLTKGLAWCFSDVVYVAVTNHRLLLLTNLNRRFLDAGSVNTFAVNFSNSDLVDGPFNTTILEIQKPDRSDTLQLRFKPGYDFFGSNKYDFIAALMHGKGVLMAAQA